MHGSVCLFSKYLNHLLEGENLEELDISSAVVQIIFFIIKNIYHLVGLEHVL